MEEKIETIKEWLGTGSINIFGLPMSGKDTQGIKLAEALGAKFLSSGLIIRAMEKDERGGMQPREMAELFYHIATCRSPRPQYVGGTLYRIFCFLNCLLPTRLVNWIEGKMYS